MSRRLARPYGSLRRTGKGCGGGRGAQEFGQCCREPLSGSIRPRGYGFIRPDDGGKDVFVHITALEALRMRALSEGQRVRYQAQSDIRPSPTIAARKPSS